MQNAGLNKYDTPGYASGVSLCYYLVMKFAQAFNKVASTLKSLKDVGKAFKSNFAKAEINAMSNDELRRQLRLKRVNYSDIGSAPRVGKSGNPLTADYMAKTYGIKNYQE